MSDDKMIKAEETEKEETCENSNNSDFDTCKKEVNEENKQKNTVEDIKNNIKSNLSNKLGNFRTTRFYNYLHALETEKRILLIACVSLSLVVIFFAWSILKLSATQKTIVLPPKVDKEFWVVAGELSTAYFEQVGFYIADRVLSVSPQTAKSSYDTLLPFLSNNPKELGKIREKLVEQADFIIKENIYQVFYPLHVSVNNKESYFEVMGTLRKFVGELYIHEVQSSIKVHYSVVSGRLKINNLEIK